MSFALQTGAGHHLGFLLLAGGPINGDCIFRSLPTAAGAFELPESEYLYQLQQQGEFRWTALGAGDYKIQDSAGRIVAEIKAGYLLSSQFQFTVVRLEPA